MNTSLPRMVVSESEDVGTAQHHTIQFYGKSGLIHFGHAWIVPEGYKEVGKWTFNRGSLPIKYEWWPEEYYFDSLLELVWFMNDNFPEVQD